MGRRDYRPDPIVFQSKISLTGNWLTEGHGAFFEKAASDQFSDFVTRLVAGYQNYNGDGVLRSDPLANRLLRDSRDSSGFEW